MSFILDALRKSENERRLDAVPDIMRAPLAVPRERVPAWALVALGILSAALLGVTLYAVLGTGESVAPSAVDAPASPSEPLEPVAAQTSQSVLQAPPAQTDAVQTEPVQTPPVRTDPLQIDSEPVTEPTAAASPLPVAATDIDPPEPALDVSALPGYAASVAAGLNVNPLQMQLHVHSSVPASRFVVINGSRYAEGDTLREGPRVEAITAEGAVLDYRGRRFLLSPN
jgi:general secretion pathway protein B